MANSEGGVVGLRGQRAGRRHAPQQRPRQQASAQKTLWDGLNNRGVVSANVLKLSAVETIHLESSVSVAVRVPRATRAQRPVYLTGNRPRTAAATMATTAATTRRCGACSPTPIRQGASPAASRWTTWMRRASRSTEGVWRRRRAVQRLAEARRTSLLERLGGWRVDKATGEDGLTLAACSCSARSWPSSTRNATRVLGRLPREAGPGHAVERPHLPGRHVGGQSAAVLQPRLAASRRRPADAVSAENGIRRDETPAHEARREAFVNALIHGDYSAPGVSVVERMPNELAIENAGTMLIALEQYQRGGISECRNPGLQRMFLMIGRASTRARGRTIRAGWRYQHWRAPLLTTFQEPTASGLRAVGQSDSRGDGATSASILRRRARRVVARRDAGAGDRGPRRGSLQRQTAAAARRPSGRYRRARSTSLCERGLLVSDNRRAWTTYELSRRQMTPSLFDADAGSAGELSDLASDSGHLAGDSGHMAGDSGHIGADSGHMRHDSAPVSEGTTERLRRIAASIANRRRVDPERMIATISELCTGRFLTSSQLAELLGRNPEGLRRRYLTPMVRKGLLRPRYPEAEPTGPIRSTPRLGVASEEPIRSRRGFLCNWPHRSRPGFPATSAGGAEG